MALKWLTNAGIPLLPETKEYIDDLTRQGNVSTSLSQKQQTPIQASSLKSLG